jgi:glycosyltransferase involved in cell wall biosynthesis
MNCAVFRMIAPSHFVRERLVRHRGIPARKVVRIPNAVDLVRCRRSDPARGRADLGLSNGQRVILTAGNLIPPKGVDILIRAFAVVCEADPNAVLVIVGDGPERAKLEGLAEQVGVSRRTRFLGERSDVPVLLSASVLFCCPSVWGEAFGWVNAEAMACEVPIVSTTTGAIPEIVEHGKTGLLVPPGDPDAMADAICELLASPERREVMGKAGRRRAEQMFDLRRTIERHIELYSEAAAKGNVRCRQIAF